MKYPSRQKLHWCVTSEECHQIVCVIDIEFGLAVDQANVEKNKKLGALVGAGHHSWAVGHCRWCVVGVGALSRAVHVVLLRAIIVRRDVVVGCGVVVWCEVVVACFGGPGSQLG